jgi:AI-2 transport protein TqsA
MIPNVLLHSTTRLGVNVLLLLAGVLALHLAQSVIIPLLIALLLAAVLGPAAVWLQNTFKVRWSLACLMVIFGLLMFTVLIGLIFVLATSRLVQNLPSPTNEKGVLELYQKLRSQWERLPFPIDETEFPPNPKTASEVRVIQYISEATPGLVRETANYFRGWLWQGIVVLFTLLFVLLEGHMLARRVVAIFGPSPEVQAKATEVLMAMAGQVRTYLVYRTLLNFGLAFVMGVVFWAFGLSQWLTWAVLLSILNYIPYLGPIVAGAPPFADAFLSAGPVSAIFVMVLYIAAIVVEAYVLFPMVLGRSMDLNATTVMLACLFWDLVWGTTGLFLAMPIMAAIKEMLYHIPEGRAWADLMSTSDEVARPPVMPADARDDGANGMIEPAPRQ